MNMNFVYVSYEGSDESMHLLDNVIFTILQHADHLAYDWRIVSSSLTGDTLRYIVEQDTLSSAYY